MPDEQRENLGPAERIINSLINYNDHAIHNRPGIVKKAQTSIGVRWSPVTYKEENGDKIVYEKQKAGCKTKLVKLGVLSADGIVRANNRKIGEYRKPGIFPEVAAWMYKNATDVWQLDNEFGAKWASYAFKQDHRDLKVILTALMLVQSRKGDPVLENGEIIFHDDDFRDVGEAMILHYDKKGKNFLSPKMILRIHDVLSLPEIAEINRQLGFGRSARKAFLGRWNKAVEKWLRYREENPQLLEGLVKNGYRKTVMQLARRVGYKPISKKFFETLRWKQSQAKDGRRELAIDEKMAAAETWEGLSEQEICNKIVNEKPNFKLVTSMVPKEIGLSRAIVAATIEAGGFTDKDLIIFMPTLEELGLLNVQEIRERVDQAVKNAKDMRAANIVSRVKHQSTKEKLQEAADTAVKAAVEKEMKNMRVYVIVDVSGSMTNAITTAKVYIEKFLQAFPQDKLHISIFNTTGKEIKLKSSTAAGVRHAFSGIRAGGGTDYGAGVRALQQYKPKDDEDSLFIFIGDEGASDFHKVITQSELRPTAFGLIKVTDPRWPEKRFAVQNTANRLGIPCFRIEEDTFQDPYAIPRTIQALIAATPVGAAPAGVQRRKALIDQILETKLIEKPAWA